MTKKSKSKKVTMNAIKDKTETVVPIRNFKSSVEEEPLVEPNPSLPTTDIATRCNAWCFLPGISHIGTEGLLQCLLNTEHMEDHLIKIEINIPPKGKFTITWTTT